MAHFCPKCYAKRFVTVRLEQNSSGELQCPKDGTHRFTLDKDGFPRSIKK